jgi:hypothetical protein
VEVVNSPLSCQSWVDEPALFITRYEYANLYHQMTDFYNAIQAQMMFAPTGSLSPLSLPHFIHLLISSPYLLVFSIFSEASSRHSV